MTFHIRRKMEREEIIITKNERIALRSLLRKRIKVKQRTILIPATALVGIKMWKAIDCLCNYFGYSWAKEEKKKRKK